MTLYRQEGARVVLRRLRPGGRLGLHLGRWAPATGSASCTRPRRARDPRRPAREHLRPVHGPRRRRHARARGQRALRRPHAGCVGMVSMLPDMMLVAAGMAMAFKMRGEQRVAMTWFGDGSTSRGDFHEAMNWAGVQKLPVIFILENNQYAYSTPVDQQFASTRSSAPRPTGSRASRSTATTPRRCSRPPARRASARSPARARR